MKPDIPLIRHTLAILQRIGPAGLEEQALMTEAEIAAGRPLTTAQARDAILYTADRGWTQSRRDQFGQTRHWLSESGKTTLAGM